MKISIDFDIFNETLANIVDKPVRVENYGVLFGRWQS